MPKASFHHGSPLMVQPSIESSHGKDQAETHAQMEIGGSSLSGIKLQQNIVNLCKTCPSSESWLAGRTKILFFSLMFFFLSLLASTFDAEQQIQGIPGGN